jgi:hypothetical protein
LTCLKASVAPARRLLTQINSALPLILVPLITVIVKSLKKSRPTAAHPPAPAATATAEQT